MMVFMGIKSNFHRYMVQFLIFIGLYGSFFIGFFKREKMGKPMG
jgi:hypothetical protein